MSTPIHRLSPSGPTIPEPAPPPPPPPGGALQRFAWINSELRSAESELIFSWAQPNDPPAAGRASEYEGAQRIVTPGILTPGVVSIGNTHPNMAAELLGPVVISLRLGPFSGIVNAGNTTPVVAELTIPANVFTPGSADELSGWFEPGGVVPYVPRPVAANDWILVTAETPDVTNADRLETYADWMVI